MPDLPVPPPAQPPADQNGVRSDPILGSESRTVPGGDPSATTSEAPPAPLSFLDSALAHSHEEAAKARKRAREVDGNLSPADLERHLLPALRTTALRQDLLVKSATFQAPRSIGLCLPQGPEVTFRDTQGSPVEVSVGGNVAVFTFADGTTIPVEPDAKIGGHWRYTLPSNVFFRALPTLLPWFLPYPESANLAPDTVETLWRVEMNRLGYNVLPWGDDHDADDADDEDEDSDD